MGNKTMGGKRVEAEGQVGQEKWSKYGGSVEAAV